jgi:uncharacterized Zn-finger protein
MPTLSEGLLCTYCGANFAMQNNLLSHMKVHHEKKIHECLSCNKTFETTAKLRCHFKAKHGVKNANGKSEFRILLASSTFY